MLIAEAHVATDRASRYLVQLCQHVNLVALSPSTGLRARVDWSDDRGVISFDDGRCTLRAAQDVLILRVEAGSVHTLHRLQRRLGDRLEQVGRRDRLTVTWTPPHSSKPAADRTEVEQGGQDDGTNTHG